MVATGKLLLFLRVAGLAGLVSGLVLFVPWPTGVSAQEMDFGQNGGSKSGGGEFAKFVPMGDRISIGKVPVGITGLSIELTAQADLDIELWDGDVFVVGWEADGVRARVYSESEITADYNGVEITWSGWNGTGGNFGSETIKLAGTTKNTFLMKVFGYQAGDVKVAYSWVGTGVPGPAPKGSGSFSRIVPLNDRAVIGTIPAWVDGLLIDLTATNDLDIELWDDETFVVGWQVAGQKSLIYRNSPISGLYNGVRIAWSGWDGVNGRPGDEYIRVTGTTQNAFLMKVYGYESGEVKVNYSWGSDPVFSSPDPAPAPAQTPTPTPLLPTPLTPQSTLTPTPAPPHAPQRVKTWVAAFDAKWSYGPNWSPEGPPAGDDLIVIEGSATQIKRPIMDTDFTLTTGTINIGSVNSELKVTDGVTFTNNGTINAKGDLLNDGTAVNNGVYNNEARIIAVSASASFTNNLGAVLNNAATGTSSGVITNVCGGSINDTGALGTVTLAPCVWIGAGANDNWSNPVNWANGLVPPENHPVVIGGEGSVGANVLVDADLVLDSRSLTVNTGDTLTIGSGDFAGSATLSIQQPSGLLINRGTVVVSNYSSLWGDESAAIDNVGGTIQNACRGDAPFGRVTGAAVVQNACFWDGGGTTNNWSEAANWETDIVPTPGEPVLIGSAAGVETVVNLDVSLDIDSRGILTVGEGQTLNVGEGITLRIANQPPGGSIWINGTLNLNGGTLHNDSAGLISNKGTININGGTLDNQGDFLINESGGQINNVAGLISNGATFTNSGNLVNDVDSTFLHVEDATFVNSGAFTNAGAFYASSKGGDITNQDGGTLVNSGTLNLNELGIFSNRAGSRVTNSGRINMLTDNFENRGTLENTGTLEVFRFGSFQNLQGRLENQAGGVFSNLGSIFNSSGSTINNAGSIHNNRTMSNGGTLNNACGGTIDGPVSGNQPVSTCTGS